MKTIKLSILAGFILLCSTYSFAQNYIFKVLASHGNNKKGSTALVVGSVLGSTDQITVGDYSYVTLMYLPVGGSAQINKAGTYTTADLAHQLETSKASSGENFVHHVIGEPFKVQNNYMRVGETSHNHDKYHINLLLPDECKTMDAKVCINWLPLENTSKYIVKVTDLAENAVVSVETKKTSFVLDLSTIKYPDPDFTDAIIVTILSKEEVSKTSKTIAILKYEGRELADFKNKYDAFMSKNTTKSTSKAQKKIYEAIFFEENKAYIDATRCYEEAIALEPKEETYKTAYAEFRKAVFLKEEE